MSLSRCRVVLVRTHYAGNIGSAARAMRNFGLSDLVLVDPLASPLAYEARQLATHGVGVLDSARVVADLGDAVGDCVFVLGTSGVTDGPFRQIAVGTPEEQLPKLLRAMDAGPVALVFGPEPHGLANAEVTRCHGLIQIPTAADAPSLFDCDWLHGGSDAQIFHTISAGVEGTRMVAFGGALPDEEIWRIIAYLRSSSQCATSSPH